MASESLNSKHVREMRAMLIDYLRFRNEIGASNITDGDHLHEVIGDIVTEAIDEMVKDGDLWMTVDESDGLPRYGFDGQVKA